MENSELQKQWFQADMKATSNWLTLRFVHV